MKFSKLSILPAALLVLLFSNCVTESNKSIDTATTKAARTAYNGPKTAIAVGIFNNRSDFQRGIFSDGVDRMGNQAKTILMTHLAQTNRFNVLDRDNMEEIRREAGIRGETQDLMGASYVITGDVSEFGRREITNRALFGALGRGKTQAAYARVNLNVIDIRTSVVAFSVSGAGEYALSAREVAGFGSSAGYDSTLNGKVLDLAIRESVDNLVKEIEAGRWTPSRR